MRRALNAPTTTSSSAFKVQRTGGPSRRHRSAARAEGETCTRNRRPPSGPPSRRRRGGEPRGSRPFPRLRPGLRSRRRARRRRIRERAGIERRNEVRGREERVDCVGPCLKGHFQRSTFRPHREAGRARERDERHVLQPAAVTVTGYTVPRATFTEARLSSPGIPRRMLRMRGRSTTRKAISVGRPEPGTIRSGSVPREGPADRARRFSLSLCVPAPTSLAVTPGGASRCVWTPMPGAKPVPTTSRL